MNLMQAFCGVDFAAVGARLFSRVIPARERGIPARERVIPARERVIPARETVSSGRFLRRNNLADAFTAVVDVKTEGGRLEFIGVAHGVAPSYE